MCELIESFSIIKARNFKYFFNEIRYPNIGFIQWYFQNMKLGFLLVFLYYYYVHVSYWERVNRKIYRGESRILGMVGLVSIKILGHTY